MTPAPLSVDLDLRDLQLPKIPLAIFFPAVPGGGAELRWAYSFGLTSPDVAWTIHHIEKHSLLRVLAVAITATTGRRPNREGAPEASQRELRPAYASQKGTGDLFPIFVLPVDEVPD